MRRMKGNRNSGRGAFEWLERKREKYPEKGVKLQAPWASLFHTPKVLDI